MKGWGLPALRLQATKAPRHSLCTTRNIRLFNILRHHKKDIDRCQGRAKHGQRRRPALSGEGSRISSSRLPLFEKLWGNVGMQERPCFACRCVTSSRECRHPRRKWLLHFVLALTLSLTSSLTFSVPGGGLRVIFARAAPADAAEGGLRRDTDVAKLNAKDVVPPHDTAVQRGKDLRPGQFYENQREAALLGLEKHQHLWPTFAHGKSKRGSVVVYRPIPLEAATHHYDPQSDLPIDSTLLQHLLQTVPADTGFLLVVDLQNVADYIRASLEPVRLASLHKGSSLMHFVKSFEWQVIRKMFFVRPRCEGVILVNAPSIVQQMRSILEYLLFRERPGSRREKLSLSGGRVSEQSPSKAHWFLQSSSDVKALHAAVDASQLPHEYGVTLDILARAGHCSSLTDETPGKDCPPDEEFAVPEVTGLSSLYNLGEAPEHLVFSAATLAALLQSGAEHPEPSTLSSELPTSVTAKREARQKQRQKTYAWAAAKVTELNDVGAGEAACTTKKKDSDSLRFAGAVLQRKEFYASLVERGTQETPVKGPQHCISAIKEGIPGESIIPLPDLRRDRSRAGLALEVQEDFGLAHSLGSQSSILPSRVEHVSTRAQAQRRKASQSFKDQSTDRKDGEAFKGRKSSPLTEKPSKFKRASFGTEGSSGQSSPTNRDITDDKIGRRRRADVHSSHYDKRTTATRRQQKGVSLRSHSRHHQASHTTRARFPGVRAPKIRQTGMNTAPDARPCNTDRESCADDPSLQDCTTDEQVTQESSSARKNAEVKVVREHSWEHETLCGRSHSGRTLHSGTPVRREAPQRALEFDSIREDIGRGNGQSILSKHLSCANETLSSPSAESVLSPLAAPHIATSTVSRTEECADDSENQEHSEDQSQLVQTTWMERLRHPSNSLRNSGVSSERNGRQNRSQDSETASSRTGSESLQTRSVYKSHFLSEKDTMEEEFDDIG